MLTKQNPRRLKALLRLSFVLCSLFFATLLVCGVIFVFCSKFALISPLSRVFAHTHEDYVGEVKALCAEEHLSCSQVQQIPGNAVQITLDSGVIAYLSTQKNLKNQVTSLQQAMSQLTIKGTHVKIIDFRFEHVVVSL